MNHTLNQIIFIIPNDIRRNGAFSVLNDYKLNKNDFNDKNIRNLLLFLHYKGIGMGYQKSNRWWGHGVHSTLQMTNNTWPMDSFILGSLKELRLGN